MAKKLFAKPPEDIEAVMNSEPIPLPDAPAGDLSKQFYASLPTEIPFATLLEKEVFIQFRQYAYWQHLELKEVVNQALAMYLKDKIEAKMSMGDHEIRKLMKLSIIKGRTKTKR